MFVLNNKKFSEHISVQKGLTLCPVKYIPKILFFIAVMLNTYIVSLY